MELDEQGLPVGETVERDHYLKMVGREVGCSDWLVVEQPMITTFAELTGDVYFIHVDPEKAKETPFGTTIAHGFLTMSMLAHFARESLPMVEGVEMSVNYGLDKVRFIEPVKCGARIRGRFSVLSVDDSKPGRRMTTLDARVEIEGVERPALTAEWKSIAFMQ